MYSIGINDFPPDRERGGERKVPVQVAIVRDEMLSFFASASQRRYLTATSLDHTGHFDIGIAFDSQTPIFLGGPLNQEIAIINSNSIATPFVLTQTSRDLSAKEVPVDQLVCQAYESAPPEVQDRMLAQLVGKVYETAPVTLQSSLLEHLMRPLGVLALVSIANGIFAKIRLRSSWPDMRVQMVDAQNVQASDVIALVDRVQQVSVEALDGVAQMLVASPMMASSAVTAVLVAVLINRARTRVASDTYPA